MFGIEISKNFVKKELYVLNTTILLFIFRTAIPFFKYPFILLFFGYIVYTFLKIKNEKLPSFSVFFQYFYLVFLLFAILIIALVTSNKIYLEIFKEAVNIFILISFFFFLFTSVSDIDEFRLFTNRFIYLTIFLALIILLIKGVNFYLKNDQFNLSGFSNDKLNIQLDYNFSLIPSFLGIIGIFAFMNKLNSKYYKFIFHLFFILFILNIIFSGSRRGFILLSCIVLILFMTLILSLTQKYSYLKKSISSFKSFILIYVLIIISTILLLFKTSFYFKHKVLEVIGIENTRHIRDNISANVYRILSIFPKEISYTNINNKIWAVNFDPTNPESGWGVRKHNTVFPLTGNNVHIVPEDAKGYLMDKTCEADTWKGNAYSFSQVGNAKADSGDILITSSYCYVSDDFNGNWVRLYVSSIPRRNYYYDIKNKGIWQRLNIIHQFNKDESISGYLYWAKYNSTTFDSLQGYVIFAYPQFKLIKANNYVFNPEDPDSGWGSRNHKTVYPLKGKNVGIVPNNSQGYLMDYTCNSDSWNGNAYSFTRIGKSEVSLGDSIKFSAYCYVSKDFNGTWVRLKYEGSCTKMSFYDLSKKGVWQYLSIKEKMSKTGNISGYLYWSKYNTTNFDSLQGYVIYAYPEFEIIRTNGDIDSTKNSKNIRKVSGVQIIDYKKIKSQDKNRMKKKLISTNNINFKLKESQYSTSQEKMFLYRTGLGNISTKNIFALLVIQNDTDPIRNLILKLISEDTTYLPLTSGIVVDSITDSFIQGRTVRWKFGRQIFTKEYNWRKKIFGGGFNYLNWYGFHFYGDKTRSDWPHNPFLTILLYSGIIGLSLYIFFMYKVFHYYLKYIKKYPLLFIFFLITYFFAFFSSGTPFDPPVMGFFVMLPFFINYIESKERTGGRGKKVDRSKMFLNV